MTKLIINISDSMVKKLQRRKTFSIGEFESIVYTLQHNATVLPTNCTNGDMIKAMFPNIDKYKNTLLEYGRKNVLFSDDWWDAPYKSESEEV